MPIEIEDNGYVNFFFGGGEGKQSTLWGVLK